MSEKFEDELESRVRQARAELTEARQKEAALAVDKARKMEEASRLEARQKAVCDKIIDEIIKPLKDIVASKFGCRSIRHRDTINGWECIHHSNKARIRWTASLYGYDIRLNICVADDMYERAGDEKIWPEEEEFSFEEGKEWLGQATLKLIPRFVQLAEGDGDKPGR